MAGFTPTLIALIFVFAAITIVLLTGGVMLNQRTSWSHPTTRTLVYVLCAATLWTGPYMLHLITPGLQWKLWWFNLAHLGASLVVPAFLLHVATIAGYHDWFTRPRLALLSIEPSVTAVLIVTESFHSLLRTDVTLVSVGATTVMHRGIGPWWFIRSPYLYLLMAVTFLLIPIAYGRASWLTRRQLLIAGVAIAIPVGVNIVFDAQFFGSPPAPTIVSQVELTGVALAITAVMLTASVMHYRYLDLAFVGRRVAIDHLRDPYAVIDEERRIIDHNPRFRELVDADVTIYGESIESYTPGIEDVLANESGGNHELAIEREWFEVHCVPILPRGADAAATTSLEESGASGHVLIFRDITDRKHRERRLETRNEQLDLLNRIVNHDIHNEMDLSLGLSRRIRQDLDEFESGDAPADEIIEYLDQVVESSNRVVDLTETARGILDSVAETEPELEPVAIKPLIEQEYLYATTYDDAEIEIDDPIPDVEVMANDMLSSVLRNLLRNAIIHNDKAIPEIAISVEKRPSEVTIAIADNGPGISPERRDTLLTTNRALSANPGSGLGLPLTRTLVAQYDAEFSIDEREGGGTIVAITLQTTGANTKS